MSVTLNISTFTTNKISKQYNDTFEVVVGGYDVYNTRGEFYVYDENIQKFFDGLLQERIKNGLYGEKGHPSMRPGETFQQFKERALLIDDSNVSHRFEQVEIGKPMAVAGQPNLVRPVRAIIRPYGPHAEELYNNLKGTQDTAFSVRSFTKNVIRNGILFRYYDIIVSWDFVGAPGIPFAKKSRWGEILPNFEVSTVTDIEYNQNDLAKIKRYAIESGFESDANLIDEIMAFEKRCNSGCIYSGIY